ncbi:YibE/F family protein [Aggregatimonas sangjinii]|uniref:YibE/F family protein n=2 Tax=Aggregatimonas sangjinii TaxID=2583587 RepID=A0A5B7SYY9_9FLAO|nr:YibE/F family protein [Aggregatimonas sangjinii]
MELTQEQQIVLEAFENSKNPTFSIKRVDDHIFIKFNAREHHFWSPQLHLEIIETDNGKVQLYGLFGPNPTLWTFFIFLHFGVATLFIVVGIWAYSSAALQKPYGLQLGLMISMVLFWFILYAFGRGGKSKGKPQMETLYRFMGEILLEVPGKNRNKAVN